MAFDLRSDPGETHDISARLPAEEPGRIVAEFERHCAALPEQPGAAAPEPALDPAVREKLRALGYID
jgi:hypothetical protein